MFATDACKTLPDHAKPALANRLWPRQHSTQGLSWGYLKSKFQETLSIFGDKCPCNGSKNDPTAPKTTLECPHEGPFVALGRSTFRSSPRSLLICQFANIETPFVRNSRLRASKRCASVQPPFETREIGISSSRERLRTTITALFDLSNAGFTPAAVRHPRSLRKDAQHPGSIPPPSLRCRANMAHRRQSRPDCGLRIQADVPTTFSVGAF